MRDEFNERASGHERRLRRGLAWAALLSILAVSLLAALPGLDAVARRLPHAQPGWLLLAAALELASCVSFVGVFSRIFDTTPRRLARPVAWAEMAFGAVVPLGGAGGVAAGAWLLVEKGASLGDVARRSGVLFLYTSAVNVAVLAVAGVAFAVEPGRPHALLLGWLPAGAGIAVVAGFLAIPRVASRGRASDRRALRWLAATGQVVDDTLAATRAIGWRGVAALGYLLFDIAVLWACARAFGLTPDVPALVLAYQIGYLANLLPVPGGVGVLDGGIAAALLLYGLASTSMTSAVLVYHAAALWIPTTIGSVRFLRLRRLPDLRAGAATCPASSRRERRASPGCPAQAADPDSAHHLALLPAVDQPGDSARRGSR